jgi:Cation efflux family
MTGMGVQPIVLRKVDGAEILSAPGCRGGRRGRSNRRRGHPTAARRGPAARDAARDAELGLRRGAARARASPRPRGSQDRGSPLPGLSPRSHDRWCDGDDAADSIDDCRQDPQLLRRVYRGSVVGGVRAARRAATRHYTYGYGRVEDLAGLFIVTMIALAAVLAGYESIRQPTTTDLLPTSMATIGIMPIVCIRTPNSSPPPSLRRRH